ncbi:hypothetical protein FRB95_014118 [Tulasnella sp. JGI-2019a]|nr:hypothetical protein FRB95_014118 [Tulasnella sp. JGI-2019a]
MAVAEPDINPVPPVANLTHQSNCNKAAVPEINPEMVAGSSKANTRKIVGVKTTAPLTATNAPASLSSGKHKR